ncbi:50S ribosomal protein L4 [[Mycoplasma] anseris]|uniref:Large ribosomal subunit protein uL4 n=1 Tax=[Mycoplasma] anseris TaxID=92400 RepID=A0A2Z4NCK2_9BACT|nr:50S ribosomal protein L4 [[Mycoplasma] anseris]AWX69282.1 50S ribosomal protein L4 [[Mycoplasma] anseris]
MAETKKTTTKKSTTAATKKVTAPKATSTKTTSKKTTITKEELPKIQKSTTTKKVTSEVKLPKTVFGLDKIYTQAIFDAILSERGSKRLATHKVKSRAEVSGTGKKPWRQKGTGNARAGSLRSPIFVGGGRVFGPTTARNYNLKINKKARKNALFSALTLLAQNNNVLVKELKMEKPSTRDLLIELNKDGLALLNNVLLVSNEENVFLSARNLPNVHVVKITSLSVESLIAADVLVLSESDVKYLEGLVK